MNKDEYTQKLRLTIEAVNKIPQLSKWDMEKIESYIDGLFSFSKFKVGRIVKISETYPVNETDSHGWMSCRHLLTEGKQAVVKEVDYRDNKFVYLIEFAEKSYYSDDGEIKPSNRTTSLYISEKWLK
jgi:hypothetical protein